MTSGAADGRAAERAERLAAELAERDVDALLIGTAVNLRYLTGFTGSHGLAVLGAGESGLRSDGRHRFFTDFRYTIQSSEQLPESFAPEIVTGNLLEAAAQIGRAHV